MRGSLGTRLSPPLISKHVTTGKISPPKMDPVVTYQKEDKIVKAVSYLTCSLSIIGSLLIILTYILFRDLRTNVRLILFHLSIMDLGIGLSNLIGTAVDFNEYYKPIYGGSSVAGVVADGLCKSQAFFAIYSTYGSILWTNCLAVYLYFAIVYRIGSIRAVYLMIFISLFCYLMPLLLTFWLIFTHKLGPTPYGSGGWCTIEAIDPITGQHEYFTVSFGYDMWIYLTFVLVPILYVGTRFHLSLELKSMQYMLPNKFWTSVHKVDYKFLLIPLAFIVLRIWTCIMTILSDYLDMNIHTEMHGSSLIKVVYYLSVIGDSGQGAANGLTFVLLTKKVREKMFCNPFKKCKRAKESEQLLNSNRGDSVSISSESISCLN